jgi:hypothetical protein
MSYDLHLEKTPNNLKLELLSFGEYPQALGVRGLHKLVTRFIKCFFTPKGSDLSDVNYGTTLMQFFGGSGNPRDFAMLAAQAVNETVEKLREYDSLYTLDDDERMLSAELLNVVPTTDGDGVDVYVSVRNVEGSTAKFVFPLTLVSQ